MVPRRLFAAAVLIALTGCTGEYCQTAGKGGAQCGYLPKPLLEPEGRPSTPAAPPSAGSPDAAPWPFPPPTISGGAVDGGRDV